MADRRLVIQPVNDIELRFDWRDRNRRGRITFEVRNEGVVPIRGDLRLMIEPYEKVEVEPDPLPVLTPPGLTPVIPVSVEREKQADWAMWRWTSPGTMNPGGVPAGSDVSVSAGTAEGAPAPDFSMGVSGGGGKPATPSTPSSAHPAASPGPAVAPTAGGKPGATPSTAGGTPVTAPKPGVAGGSGKKPGLLSRLWGIFKAGKRPVAQPVTPATGKKPGLWRRLGESLRGLFDKRPGPGGIPPQRLDWAALEGRAERNFPVLCQERITYDFIIPPEARPGRYKIFFAIIDQKHPDEVSTPIDESTGDTFLELNVGNIWFQNNILPAAALILVALGLVGGGGFFVYQNFLSRKTVPDLVNQPLTQAMEVLSKSDIRVGGVEWSYDPLVAELNVIKSIPPAESVIWHQQPITLTISRGPIRMPDLTDLRVTEARNILDELSRSIPGLGPIQMNDSGSRLYSALVADGRIVKTDPPMTGTLGPGALVTVTLSRGPQPDILIPDRVSVQNGSVDLTNFGDCENPPCFNLVTIQKFNVAPAGSLLDVDPQGIRVRQGERVTVTVSKGPQPGLQIPQIAMLPVAQAQEQLVNTCCDNPPCLAVKLIYEATLVYEAGLVMGINPAPGSLIDQGGAVTLTVTAPPELKMEAVTPEQVCVWNSEGSSNCAGGEFWSGKRSESLAFGSVLRFDLSKIPVGSQILTSTLRVRWVRFQDDGSGLPVSSIRIGACSVDDGTANPFANSCRRVANSVLEFIPDSASQPYLWDVTDLTRDGNHQTLSIYLQTGPLLRVGALSAANPLSSYGPFLQDPVGVPVWAEPVLEIYYYRTGILP